MLTNKTSKENTIITDFDIMLDLINKKGKLTMAEIEERFAINKKLAEEWAQILADHDLVEIRYLPIGGVEVTPFRGVKIKENYENI